MALFLNSVSGNEGADVSALTEASIDNHVVGLQPLYGVPIPVLPIAILQEEDDEESSCESWNSQIENRKGTDRYTFDELTGAVTGGPDGIPEIRLRSAVRRGKPDEANIHLFDVNGSSTVKELVGHVRNGWAESDMPKHLPELRIDQGSHEFETVNGINGPVPKVLEELIGECRILFLYDEFLPTGRSGAGRVQITRAVAGRILTIKELGDDSCELIIQPGVMTTRTARLATKSVRSHPGESQDRDSDDATEKLANRYIYKLQITN